MLRQTVRAAPATKPREIPEALRRDLARQGRACLRRLNDKHRGLSDLRKKQWVRAWLLRYVEAADVVPSVHAYHDEDADAAGIVAEAVRDVWTMVGMGIAGN